MTILDRWGIINKTGAPHFEYPRSSFNWCLWLDIVTLTHSWQRSMSCGNMSVDLHCEWIHGFRSSHRRCSVRKGVLGNFIKFTGKHLCQNVFFNKVAGLRPATLLKRRLWHRCFPVNFVKFLRTTFLQNTSRPLLLWVSTRFDWCHEKVKFSWDLF